MDVHCPRCETEYELDESKLRPGGVTVKCASCEHVFRVRKRAATQTGAPPPPTPQRAATSTPIDEDEERTWLIRREDGEIKTCRELATLQKWIVSGRMSRACEISRTGKTWKRLGDLGELAKFFDIADEARAVAAGKRPAPDVGPTPIIEGSTIGPNPLELDLEPSGAHPRAVPRENLRASSEADTGTFGDDTGTATVELSPDDARAPFAATELETVEMTREQSQKAVRASTGFEDGTADPKRTLLGAAPGALSSVPASPEPSPASTLHSAAAPVPTPPRSQAVPARPATVPPPPPKPAPRARIAPPTHGDRATAGWASQGNVVAIDASDSSAGPTGGIARGVPTDDVAFGRRPAATTGARSEFSNGRFVPTDELLDDELDLPRRGGAAKWIALVSMVLLGGAAAAMYLIVFKGSAADDEQPSEAALTGDAAVVAVATPDAAAGAVDDAGDAEERAELLAVVNAALYADDLEELERVAEDLSSADASAEVTALRARIEAARAQHFTDAAQLAEDSKTSSDMRKQGKERARAADELADEALELDKDSLAAQVAKADAQRLLGASARQVERLLRPALASDGPAKREAALVKGLLFERDDRSRDARSIFSALGSSGGDVRPRYRLALLDFRSRQYEAAAAAAREVVEQSPKHPAAALIDRASEAATAAADPMPPEVPVDDDPADEDARDDGPSSIDDYDGLLRRADKLAENGRCSSAMDVYARALDINPSGVAALTGLGFCHIDARQFASAQARFRAALGISPRYQDALWGVAEAHQQQGQRDQAIAAYERFIAEHPTSRRADMARRQIDRLGGGSAPEPAPEVEPGPEPEPYTPPDPAAATPSNDDDYDL